MPRITQRQVVEAALAQLRKRGGYTSAQYFQRRGSSAGLSHPGPEVAACCAIGGVEQAIWQLTGEDVSDWRSRFAHRVLRGRVQRGSRQALYAGVMQRLNRKARQLYPEIDGVSIDTVEEVTFYGTDRTSRARVVNVFEAVLEDLS